MLVAVVLTNAAMFGLPVWKPFAGYIIDEENHEIRCGVRSGDERKRLSWGTPVSEKGVVSVAICVFGLRSEIFWPV